MTPRTETIDPRNPAELAQALIRCKSVTPDEGGALKLLAGVLKTAGFETELKTFSDDNTPDVTNLYARFGTAGPVLVLAGHTDVVPPGDAAGWSEDPFGGEIRDGVLYGRGAVDMKGGVAAMVSAALRYLAGGDGRDGSIVFLITGDEEGPAVNGTPKLLDWAVKKGERFDHCLLAEPSSRAKVGDEIKIGRRGSLSGVLTVHGTQGHVAYPAQAVNPIRRMMLMLNALSQPLDYGTPLFERSNLEVTSIDVGNETVNVIPAKAVARFNIRFNDAHTAEGLKALIAERVERTAGGGRHKLEFLPGASSSFVTPHGPFLSLVALAVEAETGGRPKPSTGGGTSDARFIKDHCPVIELGLVNATMHQVDERVAVADLETLTGIYTRVLERYFGGADAVKPRLEPVGESVALPEAISAEGDLEAAVEIEANAAAARAEEMADALEAALKDDAV